MHTARICVAGLTAASSHAVRARMCSNIILSETDIVNVSSSCLRVSGLRFGKAMTGRRRMESTYPQVWPLLGVLANCGSNSVRARRISVPSRSLESQAPASLETPLCGIVFPEVGCFSIAPPSTTLRKAGPRRNAKFLSRESCFRACPVKGACWALGLAPMDSRGSIFRLSAPQRIWPSRQEPACSAACAMGPAWSCDAGSLKCTFLFFMC